MSNGKSYDNSRNSCINKKDIVIEISYFPELHTHSKSKIEGKLDLPDCATK